MNEKFTLILPNKSESLVSVGDFMSEIGNKARFDPDKLQDILIAVDEACTNIIRYAFENGEEATFTIICQITTTKLTICLINQGKRFDPTSSLPSISSRKAADLAHGRGILFMHHFMDELKYEYHPQKGNILYMIKYKGGHENGSEG